MWHCEVSWWGLQSESSFKFARRHGVRYFPTPIPPWTSCTPNPIISTQSEKCEHTPNRRWFRCLHLLKLTQASFAKLALPGTCFSRIPSENSIYATFSLERKTSKNPWQILPSLLFIAHFPHVLRWTQKIGTEVTEPVPHEMDRRQKKKSLVDLATTRHHFSPHVFFPETYASCNGDSSIFIPRYCVQVDVPYCSSSFM